MLKNKDGSYNKFPLVIISLIILISICVIGMFIIDNLPKSILDVQNNSQLHNVEETTYFNYNQTTLNDSGYHTWITPHSNATYNYSGAVLYTSDLALQNISSVILIPFGTNTLSGLSILFLILIFPIMLIVFKSRQALTGMLIITMFIWAIGGFTYSNVILVIVIIAIIYTFMTGIFNK